MTRYQVRRSRIPASIQSQGRKSLKDGAKAIRSRVEINGGGVKGREVIYLLALGKPAAGIGGRVGRGGDNDDHGSHEVGQICRF